ncbi:uncharacterized protein DS421_2g56570 [Arachis hypogaea]|nr:uncharacterized protein DS421_2g56570 [Arachis hypogaea]
MCEIGWTNLSFYLKMIDVHSYSSKPPWQRTSSIFVQDVRYRAQPSMPFILPFDLLASTSSLLCCCGSRNCHSSPHSSACSWMRAKTANTTKVAAVPPLSSSLSLSLFFLFFTRIIFR